MSLRWFHILFVTLAALLFGGLAAACFYYARQLPEQNAYFIAGIVGSILGVSLLIYGLTFYFKMRRL